MTDFVTHFWHITFHFWAERVSFAKYLAACCWPPGNFPDDSRRSLSNEYAKTLNVVDLEETYVLSHILNFDRFFISYRFLPHLTGDTVTTE